jgi:hypothetical protein
MGQINGCGRSQEMELIHFLDPFSEYFSKMCKDKKSGEK